MTNKMSQAYMEGRIDEHGYNIQHGDLSGLTEEGAVACYVTPNEPPILAVLTDFCGHWGWQYIHTPTSYHNPFKGSTKEAALNAARACRTIYYYSAAAFLDVEKYYKKHYTLPPVADINVRTSTRPNLQVTKKDLIMSDKIYEETILIRNKRAEEVPDEVILEGIQELQNNVNGLKALNVKSRSVNVKILDCETQIAGLVKVLDSRTPE